MGNCYPIYNASCWLINWGKALVLRYGTTHLPFEVANP
jgi:hypothetical protein